MSVRHMNYFKRVDIVVLVKAYKFFRMLEFAIFKLYSKFGISFGNSLMIQSSELPPCGT